MITTLGYNLTQLSLKVSKAMQTRTKKALSALMVAASISLAACSSTGIFKTAENLAEQSIQSSSSKAVFSWFEYQGKDDVFKTNINENQFRNPILTGYYPDPSVVVVGDDYYMVHSTFGFYPGLPVFHSTDLVNWTQLGNAIDRPDMLPYEKISHTGYLGAFAPTIEYHNGLFYILNTCVQCGGNFALTAENPAGPWSDPIWLPHIDGIDPSLFIDDDGKFYIVHNKKPAKENIKDSGHRLISVMEVDSKSFTALSEDIVLVDGATPQSFNTHHIEGPHLYKIDGKYLLSAAGGGTGRQHQQLVYRSDSVFGSYQPNANNPILTQVGQDETRPNAVTSTGHADIFKDANGDWWAVFLGTRVYGTPPEKGPANFNTGRETFLLPVTWKDGWPIILAKGQDVPSVFKRPSLPKSTPVTRPITGNYTINESFKQEKLADQWLFVRAPKSTWWELENGHLSIQARANRLGNIIKRTDSTQPSFIGQRLAHLNASVTTKMYFSPENKTDEAGLMAVQSDFNFYAFGLGVSDKGESVLRVRMKNGFQSAPLGQVVAEVPVNISNPDQGIYLRTSINKAVIDFEYSFDGKTYSSVLAGADATVLTSAKAGGFVGTVVGLYAEGEK
ncbi:MAG TPA: glycoside hydrolase 43 family protein [Colwellia sp.]|nr:glycoside hydrolase 43 family protein [Colwellia sp.]|tara:strand:+ start:9698 stop:11551 length:1854 start_codon:yes stop_codon:yes gene_type:complete